MKICKIFELPPPSHGWISFHPSINLLRTFHRFHRPLVLLNFDATGIQGNLQVTFLTSQVLRFRQLAGWRNSPRLVILGIWKRNTIQGTNISHLGKRKIIFKMPCLGDMLVAWRVCSTDFWQFWNSLVLFHSRIWHGNFSDFHFHISTIFMSTLATIFPVDFKNIEKSQVDRPPLWRPSDPVFPVVLVNPGKSYFVTEDSEPC